MYSRCELMSENQAQDQESPFLSAPLQTDSWNNISEVLFIFESAVQTL